MKQDDLKIRQEVRSIYQRMVGVMLDFDNPEDLEKTLHTDFIGYGTAKHEFLETVEDVKKMAQLQKEQLEGQDFRYERKLISEKIFANGTSCLILEEFDLFFPGMDHHLLLRLSSLLERIDGEWLVTHVHGSTPDSDIAEEEAFPEQGLRRKNEELEAKIRERTRELEIEAALERTRAQSLQMQHSSELNEVSKVFHEQLLGLGVDSEFSFVWLPDEDHKTHLFWTTWASETKAGTDYHSRAVRYPLDKSEPYTAACFADWESGVSVHEHFVPPGEIKAFFASWEELLEGADGLKAEYFPEGIYYTEAFMKYGCFGIDIRRPLTAEEKAILHRFAVEFERTYTRFLDLQKAEAQAREAQIEAALERVRSASMAMQKTEHIAEVAVVFLDQLKELGLNFIQAWIDVFHLDAGYIDIWFSPLEGVYDEPRHLQLPSALFEDTTIKSWKAGNTFSYLSLKSKEEVDALVSACDAASGTDYFSHFQEILKLEGLEFVDANHKYGTVSKSSFEKATTEEEDILHRFAKVFEQTYTRFLDLQKAEAQAREAQIETALERVRSRSMAMQSTGELKAVIRVIFDQLAGLNINAEHAGIVVDYSPGQAWNFWVAETQEIPSKITVPYLDVPWDRQYAEAKEKGLNFFTTELNFEQKNTFYEELLEHIPGLTQETREFYMTCPGLAISTAVQEDIGLYIENFSGVPYSEEENTILKRFGTVFQQTYTRFLDLKKAEAQARESQIELGLERVRARAMAMQASEELADLVITVFRELSSLDIVLTRCLIWIFDPQDDSGMVWMANSEDPDVADSYYVPYHDHPAYHEFLEGWKSGHPKWEYSLEGEVKESWDEILVYGYFESLPENIKEAMRAPERVMLSGSFNNFGVIQTASLEPLSQENLDILYRFSRVFEQSYTRFLDLQRAEARFREAEIETALERIRAQVTGMQESSELLDIVVTMRSEFLRLGHEAHYFWHMRWLPDTYQKAMTSGDGTRIGMVMELPRHIHGDIPLLAAWEEGEQPTVVYAMDAETAVAYVDKMVSLGNFQQIDPQAPSAEDIQHIGGLTFVMARTTHGEIGFSLPGVVPDPPAEALETLVRFAGVFDLAYRRFEDLKESEQQKREAEIELALERVRARTMAMQKSEELADAAFVLFEQLRNLGGNLWGTGFGLCQKDGEADQFWFAYEKGVLPPASVPNTTDPAHKKMYKGWKDKKDFLAIEASGEDLKKHYEYMMSLDEVRPFFQEILNKGLSFPERQQWNAAYFTYGYLLVITLEPYPEPDILCRFARVFDQTYTRFLDLQKAEAQARESEIQLALERVRASTMAMQHSEELSDVLSTLFKQFDILGINPSHAVLTLIDKEKNTLNFRTTGTDGYRVAAEQEVDLHVADAWVDTTEKWKKSTPNSVNVNEYPPEVLPEVWEVYADILAAIPEKARPRIEDFPDGLYITEGYCRFGYIGFAHDRRPTEEEKEIVKRIAGEFGTLYQRFLDLQKAEAQAREAQIEASLERVRAQTMAMHQSEDLKKSAAIVFEELEKLDLSIERSGIGIFDRESRSCRLWTTVVSDEGLKELVTGITSLTIHPMLTATFEAWEKQEPLSYVLEGKELKDYYEIVSKSEFILSEEVLEKSASLPREYYHYTPFGAGGLYFFSDSEPTISDTRVMRRFAEVFDMTYTRYEDLKKAEEQAREAQIEAALEKVRSRTMAMQHSDELPAAANVLFLEIQALGIPAWSCGYNILAEDKKSATCFMSSEGTLQTPFKLRLGGESSFDQFGEFVSSNETFMIQELGGEALVAHYDFMKSFPDLQPTFEEIERLGLELPTYQINHLCKFSHGFLLFITYEPVPDAHDIFKRFTAVFEQTYTRFLDLKNMEAQARESRIETALERVRARALAMQEPEELKDVARVMRQEMGLLGVEELETSSIYIHDPQAGGTECWYAIKDIRNAEKVMVSDHFALDLKETWVGREMLKFYSTSEDQVSIVMKGDHRKEWIDYCEAHSKALKGYYGEEIPERTYHLYKFSHGAIGAATPGDLSEESWGLLKRAASVFSLAYSRFRDLTQARLDLQRLKEEKKRAEDALKELQLTQQQLVHAEKMASLGELTAGIAHEIQNPLNFVNNFSEVSRELIEELLEELKNGDAEEVDAIAQDVIQNLEKILHHGRRADSIVKGMLQHSRSGEGKKEPIDLSSLADEYLRLAYHGLRAKDKSFNASMETDFDPGLPEVEVVPQDIGRVLLNLITNAFHAVKDRRDTAPEGYMPTVWVTTKKTEDGVEISVRDNGGGIPEGFRDKIFQPFFTTKPTGEGTGLGLSMSYDIITKGHGGTLEVDTAENQGATFTIRFKD